eukprot:CAMPEP_0181201878 /NCGR_PEP_ID=MMETSP1096-20121128/18536_1 /TAXON_ID=156174 ORGANISM="Chrysochromulina ericina, Strain CCMP281" /NCGR_SAMPLE_ID=MMETSP1096 /ASSEMBLY_ACC=CAM_ASM_000453 /LENGTH=260 /DNA_ID=CAMNT_0023292339 /DNA_START=202 /DNA_END=982 /DNA_ORIENTATION=-
MYGTALRGRVARPPMTNENNCTCAATFLDPAVKLPSAPRTAPPAMRTQSKAQHIATAPPHNSNTTPESHAARHSLTTCSFDTHHPLRRALPVTQPALQAPSVVQDTAPSHQSYTQSPAPSPHASARDPHPQLFRPPRSPAPPPFRPPSTATARTSAPPRRLTQYKLKDLPVQHGSAPTRPRPRSENPRPPRSSLMQPPPASRRAVHPHAPPTAAQPSLHRHPILARARLFPVLSHHVPPHPVPSQPITSTPTRPDPARPA